MPEKSPTHPPSPPKSPLNSNPNPSSDFDPKFKKSQPSTTEIQNPPPETPFDDSQKKPDQETVTAERNQQMVEEDGVGKEQHQEDQDPDYEEEEEDEEEEGIIMPISPPSQSSLTRSQSSKRSRGRPNKRNIRKNVGVKKHEIAINKKVQDMSRNFKPFHFVPSKGIDFSKHEENLRNLGLWDFAHLEFDSVIRGDLIMQLIVTFVPKNRVSRVNGVRVKVSRADLARALKLSVKKPPADSVVESFSDEFITFLRGFVSNRMLLHAEEVWSTPNEVVGYLKMIEERQPQKVDWAGLIWFMMEKELSQGSSLEECYYASHFQQLIKDQKEDLLKASSDLLTEVQEVVEVTLVDNEEGGDTKMLDAEVSLSGEKKSELQSMEFRLGQDCITQVGEDEASLMGRKDGDSEVERKGGESEVAQKGGEVAQKVGDSEVAQKDGDSEVAQNDGGSDVALKDGDSEVAQKDGASEVVQKDVDSVVALKDGDSELAQHNGGSVLTELNVGSVLAQHNVGSVLAQKDGDCEMAHKDDYSELQKNCDTEMVVKDCDDDITGKDGDADITGKDGDAEMAQISVKNVDADMGVKDSDTEMTVEDDDVDMAVKGRGVDAVKSEVDDVEKGANERIGGSWLCLNEAGNVGNNVGSGECADIHAENSENMYVDMAALGVQGQWLVDGRDDGCQPFLQRCSMAGAKMSTESTGPHLGIKDVEDEDGEIDGQVQGFKILPKSAVDGMSSVSLMEAFGTGQLPYAANEIVCSTLLGTRVDNDMMFANSSLFNHSGKREIDFEHDISQHSLNENHKRMRMDGHWEHKSADMGVCVEEMFNLAVKMKSALETSKGDTMQKDMLHSQRLQEKDAEIMLLRYKVDELQRKRQAEVSRRDRELYLMNGVIDGYRRAMKETQRTFTEYRKRCQIPDKPIYKDAGSGGVVKSITELKREQLLKEEEQRNMQYMLEETFQKILNHFEAELLDVADDVEGWNRRLKNVAVEFELIRERMVKPNTSENVEMMSEDIHNGHAQSEAVHHVQSVGTQDEVVQDNDPNSVDLPNEAVHNDVVQSGDVPNEAVQNDVLSVDVLNVAVQNGVAQSGDVPNEAVQRDDTDVVLSVDAPNDVVLSVDVPTVAVQNDVQSVAVPNEAVQRDDTENEGVQTVQRDDTHNEGIQSDDTEIEDVKNDDTQVEDYQNEAQGLSELPSIS